MNFETTQPSLTSKRNLGLLFLFAVIGVLISLGTYAVSGGFERIGVGPMIAVILLFVPAMFLVVTGVSQGVHYLSDLRAAWTWWHWLFLLLTFSTLVFRLRDNSAVSSNPIDAFAFLRIGPELIVVVVLWLRLRNRETNWRHSLFQGLLRVLAIYGIVCVISSVWSVYPAWTLYKSLELLIDVSTIAAILATISSSMEIRQMCNWIWLLYGIDLVWAWIGAAIWPSEVARRTGPFVVCVAGNFFEQSGCIERDRECGRVSRGCALRSKGRNDRAWYTLLLAFGLITLMASQTRNSMAGFVVGAILILVYERRVWLAPKLEPPRWSSA